MRRRTHLLPLRGRREQRQRLRERPRQIRLPLLNATQAPPPRPDSGVPRPTSRPKRFGVPREAGASEPEGCAGAAEEGVDVVVRLQAWGQYVGRVRLIVRLQA